MEELGPAPTMFVEAENVTYPFGLVEKERDHLVAGFIGAELHST